MSDFKVGDVVLIKEGGWGIDPADEGKYLKILSIGEKGVDAEEWGEPLISANDSKVCDVWFETFGKNPMILLGKERSLLLEEHPLESYPNKNSSEERQLLGNKFQVNGCGDVYKIIDLVGNKYSLVNDSTPTDTECGKHTKEAVYRYFDEGTWVFLDKNQVEDVKPIKSDGGSSAYYDIKVPKHYLQLIKNSGVIKVEQLIDIIFNNDFDFGCAFKALVRAKGITDGAGKEGNTLKYELNKIGYYSDKIEEKYNWKVSEC